MRTKLIVRLLDAAGVLLAWAPLRVRAPGDGTLVATGPCVLIPTEDGAATELVLHWPDLHIQRRERFAVPLLVRVGVALQYDWTVVWTFPSDTGPLPAVTVGSIAVSVPVGGMGAVAP